MFFIGVLFWFLRPFAIALWRSRLPRIPRRIAPASTTYVTLHPCSYETRLPRQFKKPIVSARFAEIQRKRTKRRPEFRRKN
jgi:hypothetical protein